jgi:putative IMPACT (imprinted ancient) family translation regulator|eukprot:COSAG06_NODE_1105_length_10691_cov_52.006514_5_plen_83_part_00
MTALLAAVALRLVDAAATHWFSNTGPKFVERRRGRLQQYLNDLVEPPANAGTPYLEMPEVQDFLGVRYVSDALAVRPCERGS